MRLNLVATYDICGKRFVCTHCIRESANLIYLDRYVSINMPVKGIGFVPAKPINLMMCKSGSDAESVADAWSDSYRKDGRLWDGSPIDGKVYAEYMGRILY